MAPALLTPQLIQFLMKLELITDGREYEWTVASLVAVEEDGNLNLWFQYVANRNSKHVAGFGICIRPAVEQVDIEGLVMSNNHDPELFAPMVEKFRVALAESGLGYCIDMSGL